MSSIALCRPACFASPSRSWRGAVVALAAAVVLLGGLGGGAAWGQVAPPTLQAILVGHWQIQEANGVLLIADFQPDGSLTESVASPGRDQLLEVFRRGGMVLRGHYTFTSVNMATFTIDDADFKTPEALVDPGKPLSLRHVEVCRILFVNPNRLIFQGPQGQFLGVLTRTAG